MPSRSQKPFQILIIEDNPGDVGLTVEALRDARIPNEVHVVMDGEEALQFLRCEGKHAKAPKPDLVFLDLCIPKVDGHQVLSAMKADPRLRRIPVVVVSSSGNDRDIQAAYEEQASTYVVKPADLDEYFTAIRALKELWFHIAALPRTAPTN